MTPRALERLDRFEGEMYRREQVEVVLADHQTLRAETYVMRPEYYHRLSQHDWTLEGFLSQGRSLFLAEYVGMQQVLDNP